MRAHPAALGLALAAVLTALLAACPVPIPPLGYESESRHNLPATRPSFIEPGRTRRAEVLLTLGAPDRAGEDETWFAYFSSRHQGGVAFVAGGMGGAGAITVQGYLERRLLLRFDARGVVESAEFEERVCPRLGALAQGGGGETAACLDVAKLEPASAAPATPEALIAGFNHAVWMRSRGCLPRDGRPAPELMALRGAIALTDASIVFTGGELHLLGADAPPSATRLPYSRVAALSISNWPDPALNVLSSGGTCFRVVITDAKGHRDEAAATQLRRLLEERTGLAARPM